MAYEHVSPSKKHVKTRIIIFISAIVVALVSFGLAAFLLTNRDAGMYTITPDPKEDCGNYATGFELRYHVEGKSNENKVILKEVKAVYEQTMERLFKLTDPVNEYEGYFNLASLNKELAKNGTYKGTLPKELYDIINETNGFTVREEGYSIFAGAVNAFWNTLLALDDPTPYDPLKNETERGRLETIAHASDDLSRFQVYFHSNEKAEIEIIVDPAYYEEIRSVEGSETLLDFGVLRDAYRARYVIEAFYDADYPCATLTTESGIAICMEPEQNPEYVLYTLRNGKVVTSESKKVSGHSICVSMNDFALAENTLYYTISDNGKTYYRNPHYRSDGTYGDHVLSSYVISEGSDAVYLTYINYCLHAADSEEEIEIIQLNSEADCYVGLTYYP